MPVREKYEVGKMEYEDPSIRVDRIFDTVRVTDQDGSMSCNYYVVRIKIASPTQLRTDSVDGFNSRMKDTVENMTQWTNAVVAINGDYFSEHPGSFVLRQGVLYRNSVDENHDILLNRNESFNVPAWKVYRKYLFVIIAYYLTDIAWGILESCKLSALLFADTTI